MGILLTILIAIIAILLILVVMIQNPKGGGLSSAFGGSQTANQIMGAANSGNLIERVTWMLAGALLVLSLVTGILFKGTGTTGPKDNTKTNITTPMQQQPNPPQGGGPTGSGGAQ